MTATEQPPTLHLSARRWLHLLSLHLAPLTLDDAVHYMYAVYDRSASSPPSLQTLRSTM